MIVPSIVEVHSIGPLGESFDDSQMPSPFGSRGTS